MKIETVIQEEGLSFDRYLGSTLTLPHSGFDNIKIQPNDTAIQSVINLSLKKLYDNYLYLYRSSRVASNIIPVRQIGFAGVSANGQDFRWFTFSEGISSSQFVPLSTIGLYNLDNTKCLTVAKNNNLDVFSIFMSSGENLVVYNTDSKLFVNALDQDKTLYPIISTVETYPDSGIFWKSVHDFAFGVNNSLYVLDLSAHRVVKYDATGFKTDDNIFLNKLIYKDTIGGFGDYNSNDLFNGPRSIDVYDANLYVLDSGNGVVKKYDNNLNWETTYRLFRDFLSAYPIHLSHDSFGNMYVLTTKNKIYKYDNNFQNKVEIPLDSLSAASEEYRKVVFSPSDPSILYVISDKNIYKKLITQPDEDIGFYLPYLFKVNTEEKYTQFSSISTAGGDLNFVFSNTPGNVGRLTLWYDNINLFDVLATNNFDVYTYKEILINREEYLQNWVFNKAIAKLLINHMRLRDQIVGRFIAKRDIKDNITFRGTRYFLPAELKMLEFEQDIGFYIGMNEVFQNNIVNRCLEKIYEIQLKLYDALTAETLKGYDDNQTIFID